MATAALWSHHRDMPRLVCHEHVSALTRHQADHRDMPRLVCHEHVSALTRHQADVTAGSQPPALSPRRPSWTLEPSWRQREP